ncbi:DUF943 family protein [Tolumonas lignilytica]|uniref:DUF943 family protein n=1 Tax=Tolumonas lignilytica TaxID=1283284 RepID=UPI000465E407|nr:DUF943 family protein [Tolumonas lignilytica]
MKRGSLFFCVLLFVAALCFISWSLLRVKIENIYENNNDNRSIIVMVSNPPTDINGAISFWDDHKVELMNSYHMLHQSEYFLFVKNFFEMKTKEEAKQICIPSRKDEKKPCINLDDRLFFVARKRDGYWMGFYDYYDDESCNVFISDTGEKQFINCNKQSH